MVPPASSDPPAARGSTRKIDLIAPPEVAGLRLDVALTRLAPDLSRARIQKLVEDGRVRVAGRSIKAAAKLRGGERLEVEVPPPEPSSVEAQDLPLTILFEDRDLLVLDKAAGMVVHPARGSPHSTVVNALLHHLGPGGPDGARLGLVHRLDKDTSGCLVVAKRETSLAALQASFKAHQVEKVYLALCHGRPAPRGHLDTPYGRHPTSRLRFTSKRPSERRAVTDWRLVEPFEAAALVEVTLQTGRTHQIRVHLSEHGHPLLADETYGGARREARLPEESPVRRAAQAIGRQALHAARLAFDHPRTGKRLAVEAPLPADFAAALEILRHHT